jgi:hypothetical protein
LILNIGDLINKTSIITNTKLFLLKHLSINSHILPMVVDHLC